MKPKASTARKIEAFRMAPYTARLTCSQLGCLVLTLALLALPLAGTAQEPAPILIPLATELVPLGTSLESPPAGHFSQPSFVAPARLVLGPPPISAFGPNAGSKGRTSNITSLGFPDSCAKDLPHG